MLMGSPSRAKNVLFPGQLQIKDNKIRTQTLSMWVLSGESTFRLKKRGSNYSRMLFFHEDKQTLKDALVQEKINYWESCTS